MTYDVAFTTDHGQGYSVTALDEKDLPVIIEKKRNGELFVSEDMYGNTMVIDLSKVVAINFTKRNY